MKYFVYIIIVIVAVAIAAGFFIVGSPKQARLARFDDQRVQNLQFLQSEIINYWVNKERLPQKLSDLEDNIRGIRVPLDPDTKEPYQYKVLDKLKFSLCANFSLPSSGDLAKGIPAPESYYGAGNWDHGAGSTCFDRVIDPDIYKPVKPR